MYRPTDTTNADQTTRLLDLVSADRNSSLGSAMLRLAHMAAAQHRANARPKSVKPWSELSDVALSIQDKAEHGCSAEARSARDSGPVTTEGDR